MRLSEANLIEIINAAERVGHNGNMIDKLALDYRDTREAVKILRDQLDKAQEENHRLRALSDSQDEALRLMEAGKL